MQVLFCNGPLSFMRGYGKSYSIFKLTIQEYSPRKYENKYEKNNENQPKMLDISMFHEY